MKGEDFTNLIYKKQKCPILENFQCFKKQDFQDFTFTTFLQLLMESGLQVFYLWKLLPDDLVA